MRFSRRRAAIVAVLACAASAMLGACSSFSGAATDADADAAGGGDGGNVEPEDAGADANADDDGASFCAQQEFDGGACADFENPLLPYGAAFSMRADGPDSGVGVIDGSASHPSKVLLTFATPNHPAIANLQNEAVIHVNGVAYGAGGFHVEADFVVDEESAVGSVVQVYGNLSDGGLSFGTFTHFNGGMVQEEVFGPDSGTLGTGPLIGALTAWGHIEIDLTPAPLGTELVAKLFVGGAVVGSYSLPVSARCTTVSVAFGSYPDPTSTRQLPVRVDNVLVRPY